MLDLTQQLKELEKLKNNLEKKDETLIICDFDDTIFSRKEQLEKSKILRENRWDLGNKAIMNIIWLENFINENYIWKDFPKYIIQQMKIWKDLILTAWFKEIQLAKIKATKIDIFNHIVVENAADKIHEMIIYVIEKLAYIPSKIVIYEDRPEHFIENKKLIEDFLWTTLEIMLVEMINNQNKPNIKKLN